MKRIISVIFAVTFGLGVQASWYWPFGDDGDKKPRLYRLMAPVSEAIEQAVACLEEGDIRGGMRNYENALAEITRIREENPEMTGSAEFMSLRNREAYIQAAIESLMMKEVVEDAHPVANTDTTELEKRVSRERTLKSRQEKKVEEEVEEEESKVQGSRSKEEEDEGEKKVEVEKRPKTRGDWLDRIDEDIANGDLAAAKLAIDEQLQHDPEDTAYLNLRAALHVAEGDLRAAEDTLHQVIRIKPNAYPGFYNLVRVCLLKDPRDRGAAAQYYKTGRIYGGPRNTDFENELRNELKAIGYQGK